MLVFEVDWYVFYVDIVLILVSFFVNCMLNVVKLKIVCKILMNNLCCFVNEVVEKIGKNDYEMGEICCLKRCKFCFVKNIFCVSMSCVSDYRNSGL